jgi:hypothetical protein
MTNEEGPKWRTALRITPPRGQLPTPRSVICSPSHMMNALPVVSVSIVIRMNPGPGGQLRSIELKQITTDSTPNPKTLSFRRRKAEESAASPVD